MNKRWYILSVIIVFTALDVSATEQKVAPFSIITPGSIGKGNAGISLDTGFESLWNNPVIFSI